MNSATVVNTNTKNASSTVAMRFDEICGVVGLFSLFATGVVLLSLQWIA
ncbi:hypothetical protein AB4304_03530 [Vibrio breoganii]|nr:hypothetical protein [Vibrio breoganii]MDN3716679.1 hypothetical protein [Vibrio breoganii]